VDKCSKCGEMIKVSYCLCEKPIHNPDGNKECIKKHGCKCADTEEGK